MPIPEFLCHCNSRTMALTAEPWHWLQNHGIDLVGWDTSISNKMRIFVATQNNYCANGLISLRIHGNKMYTTLYKGGGGGGIKMMMSSNGNIFRITGHLWGWPTGHRQIPLTKASDAELWCFLWSATVQTGKANSRDAGDLRRPSAHYDITVMTLEHCHQMEIFSALLAICEGDPPATGKFP